MLFMFNCFSFPFLNCEVTENPSLGLLSQIIIFFICPKKPHIRLLLFWIVFWFILVSPILFAYVFKFLDFNKKALLFYKDNKKSIYIIIRRFKMWIIQLSKWFVLPCFLVMEIFEYNSHKSLLECLILLYIY